MIKIAVVDDQALIREGIVNLISLSSDIEVCWHLDSAESALSQLQDSPVDIVLLDIRMPKKSGIELLQDIRSAELQVQVIMLTTFDDSELFVQSMAAGANGFLLKDVSTEKLHQAIKTVYEGGMLAEPVLLNQLSSEHLSTFADAHIEPLSKRELEILRLMAGGYTNKEIAAMVFLAPGTVRNHVSEILAKLNTTDRTRAVLKALSAGII
ncbi:response regulator [Marinicella sp. W31]|uniref:response regulator n=1 Tax=Marinicella sp. W31 TaxID=3023713 RepID=UPI003756B6BE